MKNVVLFAGMLLSFYSCKKESGSDTDSIGTSDYLPMKVGNYWVYQEFDIDTSGNVTQTSNYDSIIISKDTLINGLNYFRFDSYGKFHAGFESNYYRDSSKNLVDSKGKVLFSEVNFSDTLVRKSYILEKDTFFTLTGKMERINNDVVVPNGIFTNVLNLKCTVTCNPKFTNVKNPRYNKSYYAHKVGNILHSASWLKDGAIMEYRLIRYAIKR